MSGQAGYVYTISVSTSQSGTYLDLLATTSGLNRTADVLDDTDISNVGYHSRILGLLDAAISAESNWSATDAALLAIESALENRTSLWVKILPDNVVGNGKKFPVVVENYNLSTDVTGLSTVSLSFQGTGAVIADDA